MICDGKVVSDKVYMDWWGVSKESLEDLQNEGLKQGFFEKTVANDKFKYWLYKEKKEEHGKLKKTLVDIEIPKIRIKGSKKKYFITDIILAKKPPEINSYTTYVTVYGEKMRMDEFIKRAGLYNSFFSKNKIYNAESFMLNGIRIAITKDIKDVYCYNIVDMQNNQEYLKVLKEEAIKITGCGYYKISCIRKFTASITHNNFKIERVKR